MPPDQFATRVYVVGEVLVSAIAMIGALTLLFYSADEGTKLAGSGLLSAVTVFWFQRRSTEQSTTQLALLADGKITQLLQGQAQTAARVDGQMMLLASLAKRQTEEAEAAAKA